MRDRANGIYDRVRRKVKALPLMRDLERYSNMMLPDSPLAGVPMRVIGDASGDPTEFFDHYDSFAVWAARKIHAQGRRLTMLDVGSIKMMNAIMSVEHDVTSLVLRNCGDQLSDVRYVVHDVSMPLPFADGSFDVFTSMASLQLIGLGRYGDRLDSNCLPNLVKELNRVMRPEATLLISMCLGKNVLNFNNSWFLDMATLQRVFSGWRLVDHLVDNHSSPKGGFAGESRFTRDTSTEHMRFGDYRVIFLHFERLAASE